MDEYTASGLMSVKDAKGVKRKEIPLQLQSNKTRGKSRERESTWCVVPSRLAAVSKPGSLTELTSALTCDQHTHTHTKHTIYQCKKGFHEQRVKDKPPFCHVLCLFLA